MALHKQANKQTENNKQTKTKKEKKTKKKPKQTNMVMTDIKAHFSLKL